MKTMAIMIGIQGSGKSTFCKKYLSNYQRVNLDTLHTRNKEKTYIEKCFENNENIVIDNTNSRIEDKKSTFRLDKDRNIHFGNYINYEINNIFTIKEQYIIL